MELRRTIGTMPHSIGHFAEGRLHALESVHGITMIAKHHFVVSGTTLAVALATSVFPGSRLWIGPSKVAFTKFQDPSMVQSLELLRHVIGYMPDGRAVLVVDLAIVPYL